MAGLEGWSASAPPPRPATRGDFKIAILCALPLEADAVDALFDHHWDEEGNSYGKAPGDPNAYSTGFIGRHNVVLAHMPGMGNISAAGVASSCKSSFPNINLALVVGICGSIPFSPDGEEIVFGDVIVSNGVVQYDFGRQFPHRFERKDTLLDTLARPNTEIRGLIAKLKSLRNRKALQAKMHTYLKALQSEPELMAEYPGAKHDKVFHAAYLHLGQGTCEHVGCNGEQLSRRRLTSAEEVPPMVHFGLVASGNTVMKSGKHRDEVAKETDAIAFEMESAGAWDIFPCVVIKGVCDYADSHKTKGWQRYGAATAAACMKSFLGHWSNTSDGGV